MKNAKGKIITITSMKGGVGKSVFLLNLAGIYQRLEKKVLLIDLDFSSGALALSLNVPEKKSVYHALDDLMHNRFQKVDDYISSYNEWIDVISCPKDPRHATKIEIRYLDILLERVSFSYDVILVDTTHGFSKNNIIIYDHSDMLVYLMSNDLMDLKNSKNFMAIMKDIEMEHFRVILNKSYIPNENYFSNFDIHTMIEWNIDYTLSTKFYVKNLNGYLLEGMIPTLDEKTWEKKYEKDSDILFKMANDFIEEGDEDGKEDIYGRI